MNFRSELVRPGNRKKVAFWYFVTFSAFFFGVATMLYFVL
jgi:hypothetical protein